MIFKRDFPIFKHNQFSHSNEIHTILQIPKKTQTNRVYTLILYTIVDWEWI